MDGLTHTKQLLNLLCIVYFVSVTWGKKWTRHFFLLFTVHNSLYIVYVTWNKHINEPRSDRSDLLAIKVISEIFTEKERHSCCEQLQKI